MNKRPRSEDAESGMPQSNQADVARKGLVSLNRLDYVLQPDLSVVTSRTNKRHFFQQTVYVPGTRAIAILNSGAEYIDPQNSYLQFTVGLTDVSAPTADFTGYLGVGSACNFIKRAILTSRSGDEIERIDEVGQLAVVLDRYMHSEAWINTHGRTIGYLSGQPYAEAGAVENQGQNIYKKANEESLKQTFIIPLGCIFGLFRSFDRLMPSMLMSGLRVEFEFEESNKALLTSDTNKAVTFKYEITQPEIVLDSYTLTDSIQRVLNEEAAIRGLELVYTSFYYHSAQPKGAGSNDLVPMNIEVRKAVSRALGVLHKIRPQSKVAGFGSVDYFRSKLFQTSSYQLRLGSLYFPHQPIVSKGATLGSLQEMYWHTQHGFGKIKTPSAPSAVYATKYEFGAAPVIKPVIDTLLYPTFRQGMAAVYTDLERSTTQRLTGIPVNNSRVAEIQLVDVFPDTSAETDLKVSGWTVDVWLHYVRLARVFLQNVEIEE
jgi:hypothetical protein